MAQKSKQGKFVNLEDVRVSYKPKDDTIHITSGDPSIPNGSFYLTLNRGTPTEVALRQLLVKNGLIHVSEGQDGTSEPLSVFSRQVASPINDILLETLSGSPRNIWIQGSPGSGKTVSLFRAVRSASLMNMTSLVVDMKADMLAMANRSEIDFVNKRIEDLPSGFLNPFYATEDAEINRSIVIDVIESLVPMGQDAKDFLAPFVSMCQEAENFSLRKLKNLLVGEDNSLLSEIGQALDRASQIEFSSVLFGDLPKEQKDSLFREKETVIVTGDRLDHFFPDNYQSSYSQIRELTLANRVGSAIVFMLNQAMFSEMKMNTEPKLLAFEGLLGRGNKEAQVYVNRAILKKAAETSATVFATGNDNGDHFLEGSFTDKFLFRSTDAATNRNHELTSGLSSGEMIWEHDNELKFVPMVSNPKESWADTNPTKSQRGGRPAYITNYYGI